MLILFMRGHVFVLVHDIADSTLNEDIQRWHESILDKRPARHDPVIIVVSNKVDLHPFCSDEVCAWIKEHSFDHIHTSAKTGENISKLFEKIRDAILVHQTDWLAPSLPALPITESSKKLRVVPAEIYLEVFEFEFCVYSTASEFLNDLIIDPERFIYTGHL